VAFIPVLLNCVGINRHNHLATREKGIISPLQTILIFGTSSFFADPLKPPKIRSASQDPSLHERHGGPQLETADLPPDGVNAARDTDAASSEQPVDFPGSPGTVAIQTAQEELR
jgi:hypothetical protein